MLVTAMDKVSVAISKRKIWSALLILVLLLSAAACASSQAASTTVPAVDATRSVAPLEPIASPIESSPTNLGTVIPSATTAPINAEVSAVYRVAGMT